MREYCNDIKYAQAPEARLEGTRPSKYLGLLCVQVRYCTVPNANAVPISDSTEYGNAVSQTKQVCGRKWAVASESYLCFR